MYPSPIINQYEQLPEIYQQDVKDFIEFLLFKTNRNKIEPEPLTRGLLGSLKGLIHMADDFDEPLEDFKEYK
ncbi:MAG: DUF2281 domain-containing protein [Candidatus Kapabacteria bacterium]|nr:DUF2281 domain-containing protein [Candidatus Kapabacteria bacterium]